LKSPAVMAELACAMRVVSSALSGVNHKVQICATSPLASSALLTGRH